MNVRNELDIEYSHVGVIILGVVVPRPERISPLKWLEMWDHITGLVVTGLVVTGLVYDENQPEIPSAYTENEG